MARWLLFLIGFYSMQLSAQSPLYVTTGLYATELYNIDFQKEQFEVQFWVWFLHSDESYIPWERTEVINAKSFSIISSTREKVDGRYFDSIKFNALVRGDWDISRYPFDSQKLIIGIEDNQMSAKLLQFHVDRSQSGLNADVLPHGWSLSNSRISSFDNQYLSTFGDPRLQGKSKPKFSQIKVEFHLKREGARLFLTIFLGFFVALLLTTLVLIAICFRQVAMIIGTSELSGIAIGALFTTMANVYTLSGYLPYTTELVLADHIQMITMGNVVMAIVVTLWTRIYIEKSENDDDDGKQSDMLRCFRINAVLVSSWFFGVGLYLSRIL